MADYSILLREHVTLKCRSLDRIFLQAYVPKLQAVGQVCTYLRWRRGFRIPSSAAFGKMGTKYVDEIHAFAKEHDLPVVHFAKGQVKEDVAAPFIAAAASEHREGVVMIGIAQEKASVWRSWKARGHERSAHPHMEWGRQMAFINHFYFYVWDADWGGAFLKTNAYAPYPVWLWLNGHEWAKRQLEEKGIGYEALDNGFLSCEDPEELQRVCDRLGSGAIKNFLWRWIRRLPSPFTQDDVRHGYTYDIAFRQFEVSETLVFDRPQAGRTWFESVNRDHLDVGRPDQVALIFNRPITRRTPGTFRTRVITKGVDPTLTCYYKSSRIKQYFKEGRALRTETVICNTRDFGIGRRVTADNIAALRAVGENANRRLCDAEAKDALPAPDVATFEKVTRPTNKGGLYAPGMRFGDPRVMAVFGAIVGFCHLIDGFTNRQLVERVSQLRIDAAYNSKHATYDLRRLRRKGLIQKIPKSHRYQLTADGRRVAVLFTKTFDRVLSPGLTLLDPNLPPELTPRSPLAIAWRNLEKAFHQFAGRAVTAA